MNLALYSAASGMEAQQINLNTISNNIANMTTTGYKRRRAEFQDLLYQNIERMGAQSSSAGTVVPTGIQVGAPADAYNQLGQDWGQPPWRPDRLAELGYAPFRDLIAAVLRHAGGVRVDHILGLFRLWWVPVGNTPDQGCYVYYDHRAMVGVLALEAHRAGAVVVGEDLGVGRVVGGGDPGLDLLGFGRLRLYLLKGIKQLQGCLSVGIVGRNQAADFLVDAVVVIEVNRHVGLGLLRLLPAEVEIRGPAERVAGLRSRPAARRRSAASAACSPRWRH